MCGFLIGFLNGRVDTKTACVGVVTKSLQGQLARHFSHKIGLQGKIIDVALDVERLLCGTCMLLRGQIAKRFHAVKNI